MTKAPRGTADMLPADSYKIHYLEMIFREAAESFGYREIRTPVFEHTELFNRSVGETTDVVQKEMYTFQDNSGRSITLRPEGTAGAARALLEHGLAGEPMPQKMYYNTSCYRYEKPQAGRLREFHQFGVECFGSAEPIADAEVIALANMVFKNLDLEDISLQINSIGCPVCRKAYHDALKEYFTARKEQLCETCLGRLEKNPMRILDCKSPECAAVAKDAPVILDYLCDDCKAHFEGVRQYLDQLDIEYTVNPRIVRGLDYYTRTVFEFVSNRIGAQGTVCGGGRYDGLVEELGGNPLPALGFGMGVERLRLVMENAGKEFPDEDACQLFVVSAEEEAKNVALDLVMLLRNMAVHAQMDICGRSVKAQMKYANKIGAKYTVVLGQKELDSNSVQLKNMYTGDTQSFSLDEFPGAFMEICTQELMNNLMEMQDGDWDDEDDMPEEDSYPGKTPSFLHLLDPKDKTPLS